MKKPTLNFLKSVPLLFLIFACSTDDDANNTGIKGKWLYVGYSNNVQDVYYPAGDCPVRTFTIKNNGTALLRITGCDNGYNGVYTWEMTNEADIYNFKNGDFDPEPQKLTLSANQDSLFIETPEDASFTDVYKRQ